MLLALLLAQAVDVAVPPDCPNVTLRENLDSRGPGGDANVPGTNASQR